MVASTAGNACDGFCVIMAGGRGTRFWPLSRARRPKQLLALCSQKSLLRETCDRVMPLVGPERILVITNAALVADTLRELPELPATHIVGEPHGRNTAPCAALGVSLAERLAGTVPVALLPADHWIPDAELFRTQLAAAFHHATDTGKAVTFGITPTRPETGYGYLEVASRATSKAVRNETSRDIAGVAGEPLAGERFIEKPDLATAEVYLASGRHYWNSGMFVWDSKSFAIALEEHLPAVADALAAPVHAYGDNGFADALTTAYESCPSISIDHGIMEQLTTFSVFKAAFSWSDIGSWDVWGNLTNALPGGNRGLARLYEVDSRNNVIYAPDKAIALVGVDDLIVVDMPDALLICRGEDAQRIREVTERLAREDRQDLL